MGEMRVKKITTLPNDYYVLCAFGARTFRKSIGMW